MLVRTSIRPAICLSALVTLAGCSAHCVDDPEPSAVEDHADAPEPVRAEPLRPERIDRRLSLGGDFSCRIDEAGSLGCWGSYIDLEQIEFALAGVEPPIIGFQSTFGGEGCVAIDGGQVRCWTRDDDEDARDPWIAVGMVEGLDDAIALSEGCALRRTGEVACGFRYGPGPAEPQDLTDVLEVIASQHGPTCMRTGEGLARCSTYEHQLELGAPQLGADPYRDVLSIATSRDSIWIARAIGQVERCTMEARSCFSVDDLAEFGEPVVELAAMADLVCARTRSGRVYCWSDHPDEHSKQELAALGYWDPGAPIEIEGIEDAVEIAVGFTHGCARLRDDSVRCWGDNRWFQLGEADGRMFIDAPTRIVGLKNAAVEVSVGTRHACMRDDQGESWCWGFRRAVADDFHDLEPNLVHIGGSSTTPAARVLTGDDLSCSMSADVVECVGDGKLATCDDIFCSDSVDVMPPFALDSVVDLVPWWGCHADKRGVSCFGHASYHPTKYYPAFNVLVASSKPAWRIHAPIKGRVIDIGLGDDHGCALVEDGRVYCWGLNDAGQLGRATPRRRSPASGDRALLVPGLAKLVSLDAGEAHTCGLDEQGTAWCWGANDHGQLGAPLSGHGTPVSVPNMPSLISLQVADTHACGIDHDARVWCWGDDREGQLGDGPGIVGEGPRVITGLPAITQLASGAATSCAIDEHGEVWCWGRNDKRQASTSSPPWSRGSVEVAPSRIVAFVQ
jgi:hypothetical protein